MVSDNHCSRQHLKDVFNTFDDDNSGHLSVEELVSLSFALGLETCSDKIKEDFKEADLNKDGKISKEEFMSWFKVNQAGAGNIKSMIKTHM